MRRPWLPVLALSVVVAGCGAGIADLNVKPTKYYQ
jgi:hypothetical protein